LIRLFIDCKPTPKARPRLKKGGGAYTPKKTVIEEAVIGYTLNAEMSRHRLVPTSQAIRVELGFYFRPAKSNKALFHIKTPDLDNLVKLAMDAMTGVVYLNDAQVISLYCYKHYHSEKEGIFINITRAV